MWAALSMPGMLKPMTQVDADEHADLHGQVACVARQRRLVHAVGHEQRAEEAEDAHRWHRRPG